MRRELRNALWSHKLLLRVPEEFCLRGLFQAGVEASEEMGDSFLSFVAHVREAKGLAFDLAIAAVDDEMMFFAQIAHESRYVDGAVIFDAGKSDGAKIFFGEEFETSLTDPLVDERIGKRVTSKTRRQSFVKNIFKL